MIIISELLKNLQKFITVELLYHDIAFYQVYIIVKCKTEYQLNGFQGIAQRFQNISEYFARTK